MSNLPIWNLADFYPNFNSKLIKDDLDKINKQSISFSNKYKSKLKNLSSQKLIESIKLYERIEEKIYFIKSFSFLTYCTDQLNKSKSKFYQSTQEILSEVEKNLVFFSIEINNLDKKKINSIKSSKYKSWIENLNKFKKYQQPELIEKLLMEKSLTSSSAWIKFFDQNMTRLKFPYKNKTLNETEILNLFSSPKESVRKEAAQSFGNTLRQNIFYFTFVMNNISKDLDIDKKLRTHRLETPRVKVPKGSVGITEQFCNIYTYESPGGWNIIGNTPKNIFNKLNFDKPLLINPGDKVSFYKITKQEYLNWNE